MYSPVEGVISLLRLVQLLLISRILLSWFPNINWRTQPFKFVDTFTEPILTPFRKLIPPLGGMLDISPIIPLLIIDFLIGQFGAFR